MGACWEGALYFLKQIIDEPTSLTRLRFVEFSIANGYGTLEEVLFMAIWNSHGQLMWLKAHLKREENQSLLQGAESIRELAERETIGFGRVCSDL